MWEKGGRGEMPLADKNRGGGSVGPHSEYITTLYMNDYRWDSMVDYKNRKEEKTNKLLITSFFMNSSI